MILTNGFGNKDGFATKGYGAKTSTWIQMTLRAVIMRVKSYIG